MPVLIVVLVVIVAAWIFGSVVLRFGGWLILIGALATGQAWVIALTVPAGVVLWLAGHYLFAFRHKGYRSGIAASILSRLPDRLEPTHSYRTGH